MMKAELASYEIKYNKQKKMFNVCLVCQTKESEENIENKTGVDFLC